MGPRLEVGPAAFRRSGDSFLPASQALWQRKSRATVARPKHGASGYGGAELSLPCASRPCRPSGTRRRWSPASASRSRPREPSAGSASNCDASGGARSSRGYRAWGSFRRFGRSSAYQTLPVVQSRGPPAEFSALGPEHAMRTPRPSVPARNVPVTVEFGARCATPAGGAPTKLHPQ